MQSQKAVLKLSDMHDGKDQRKAMKIVSKFAGVDSIDINMKDQKLTVTGAVDPVDLVGKLRKEFSTGIISVGPTKEAQKKDGDKKDEKKDGDKKDEKKDPAKVVPLPPYVCYTPLPPHVYHHGRNFSAEDDPTSCVIL